jgi:hypothetical protein
MTLKEKINKNFWGSLENPDYVSVKTSVQNYVQSFIWDYICSPDQNSIGDSVFDSIISSTQKKIKTL